MTNEHWWTRAKCKSVPVVDAFMDGWDAEAGTIDPVTEWRNAKRYASRYCLQCPVRVDCFAASMRRREAFGVFGGVSRIVRQRWLKSGRKWRCVTCSRPLDPLRMQADRTLKECDGCLEVRRLQGDV